MMGNLLNADIVIATKPASRFLNISYAALIKEIDTDKNEGNIRWQACIRDEDNSRPILGFEHAYLVEVLKILGTERKRGKAIFNEEIKEKLRRLNKRYPNPKS